MARHIVGSLGVSLAAALRLALGELLLALLASLLLPLRAEFLERGRLGLGFQLAGLFDSHAVALALQADRSDEALNLGGLGAGLLIVRLGRDLAADDVLAHVVLLGKGEEVADLGGPLWAEAAGDDGVRQARNLLWSLLDNGQVEHGDVVRDDAAAHRLAVPLALAHAEAAAALVALGHHKPHAVRAKDALVHREALLVLPTHDLKDIPLELLTNILAFNLR
mmetsp:Transcript_62290/g.123122  ORF Transcript_62290/g.123122 Transcript_62290/m.123122 type:complete len:222 (-) Transcript_62290:162-827(-)